jgi:tripartite-type tricarboxylate transporter receptor subunit TctC
VSSYAQLLSERLGQTFVVENRPGGGSTIGTEAVVRAAPDGYTLLQIASQNAWAAGLYERLNFDLLRDLAPVASIYRAPSVLVVHPSFPAKSVPELIAYARANPGKINMASGGMASVEHVYGEMFKMMAGIDMVHVPYRGGGPAMTDLLAGHVPLMFEPIATAIEYIKGGRLRALAVTSSERSEVLPDLPTIAEFLPDYEGIGWQGIAAPRNTPAEIIQKLNNEINAGLDDARIKVRITDAGATVFKSTPAEFGEFMAAYTEKWGKVIRAANIKPE